MWYPGKRYRDLKARVDRLESITAHSLDVANRVKREFNSRYADSIDRKYVFDEILECVNDILQWIDKQPNQ